MRKFSQQQLMQFLYGEASPILKMAIDRALLSDVELEKEISSLKKTQKQLDKLKTEPIGPSQKTIDAIMAYAKKGIPKSKIG